MYACGGTLPDKGLKVQTHSPLLMQLASELINRKLFGFSLTKNTPLCESVLLCLAQFGSQTDCSSVYVSLYVDRVHSLTV